MTGATPSDSPQERIAAIVLAAGAGSRFGGGKLLAPLQGRPVLQHVLDRLASAALAEVVVVLGADAPAIEAGIDWRGERRVRNPDPGRGLASSVEAGLAAIPPGTAGVLLVLGDQPRLAVGAVEALLAADPDPARPIVVPVYAADRGRNPVLLRRPAFGLVDRASGDRGLGPFLAEHPELVQEVVIEDVAHNPDMDTPADHVALLEEAWAERVRADREQVERFREVPDGTDFYAPVSGLFTADPGRTDEPVLDALLALVRPGETWLDIGAGAGRYALPIARALAGSGGRVIAVEPSDGMLDALVRLQAEHGITEIEVVQERWPPADPARLAADVALIAHVSYDIEDIGPFVRAMEAAARRLCVAVLMERQPSSIADACWPAVHGEERVSLPALPEFVELLEARGRAPVVERLSREPRRFGSRDELEAFLRRQLWIEPDGRAGRRFATALDELLVTHPDGRVGLRDQRPMPIGVVTWSPGEGSRA